MKSLLIALPLVFAATITMAQDNSQAMGLGGNLVDIANDSRQSSYVRLMDTRYEGLKGSPFFQDGWAKATVVLDNNHYEESKLKYNVYANVIVFQRGNESEYIIPTQNLDKLTLTYPDSEKKYEFKKSDSVKGLAEEDTKGMHLVLFEGKKASLIATPSVHIKKANYKGAYSSDRPYDEFIMNKNFYVVDAKNNAEKVKLNKKNLLNSLSDKESEIKKFISSQDIDTNSEEGWAKVMAYYETL